MKRRILFLAEAVSLAHVIRARDLALRLDVAQYDVALACDRRYRWVLDGTPLTWISLPCISRPQFERALARGTPIYALEDLLSYAEHDQRVMATWEAELVIGDFRLSLAASARKVGIPFINIVNAYWSPFARVPYPAQSLGFTRVIGEAAAQWVWSRVRSHAFAWHAAPVNRLLRHYGLPSLRADLRYTYCEGDYTVYPDLPSLVPMGPLPRTHQFIGPVHGTVKPGPLDDLASFQKQRPTVYVNLGSSGPTGVVGRFVAELSKTPVQVIVATAGREGFPNPSENVTVLQYADGARAVGLADLVVCNGGSLASYQALAQGRPVVGIPSNMDQSINAALLENARVGRTARSHDSAQRLCALVWDVLKNPEMFRQARSLAVDMAGWEARRPFETLVTRVLAEEPSWKLAHA